MYKKMNEHLKNIEQNRKLVSITFILKRVLVFLSKYILFALGTFSFPIGLAKMYLFFYDLSL